MKIGIDLGGTKVEIIALDETPDGLVECYRKRVATPSSSYSLILDTLCSLVLDAEQELGQQGSVGIGIPGTISPATNKVKNANTICLIGHSMQDDLEQRLARPIRISNDANCMTVSEASDGAAAGAEVVFGVIIGTGCGGGIVVNKQIITGQNSVTGEWGHNNMPWRRKHEGIRIPCYCGHDNCIETYLSGPGLVKRYRATGEEAVNVQDITARAEAGYEPAEEILQAYEENMAKALASVINILDPNVIVLAGGLSNIQRLYKNVPLRWGPYVFSDTVTTELKQAVHGDSSGVRGAAWLW